MTDFEQLVALTKKTIKNESIKNFTVKMLEENCPDYFKTAPASSSGRYHPAYALGKGGLVRHTTAALYFLEAMTQTKGWQSKEAEKDGWMLTSDDIDRMKSAVILHDFDKENYKDHEGLACKRINKALGIEHSKIGDMVHAHMGEWGSRKPQSLIEQLVHTADYLASRKYLNVDFANMEITR
jgi:hypothetical protein